MIKSIRLLWRDYLKFYKADISVVILSLLNVSICLLTLGRLLQNLIDHGLARENIVTTNNNIILMVILIILFAVSSFFRSYFISSLSEKIISKIRIQTYAKCLSLKIEQFETLKVGDLIARFGADLDLIAKFITDFLSFILRNSIMLVGASILMFTQSTKLSMIIIIIVPLLLLPILKLARSVKKLSKNTLEQKSSIYSNLLESFTNINTIYAFNQQKNKLNQFEQEIFTYFEFTKERLKARSLFFAISMGVILSSIIFVIWIGVIDILKGALSSGQIVSFIYYALIAGMSAGGIAESVSESHQASGSIDRIFELLHKNANEDNSNNTLKIEKITSIKFRDLDFTYPARLDTKILNSISFNINKGFTAIIGRSGSGKSTIMQLLLKFYEPANGDIEINSIGIKKLDTNNLRAKIAYVPQEPAIFSGSIKSNITFGCQNVFDEQITNIANITGIMDFANNFVDKLEASVGEGGGKLSGGQKQRIAIARALLMKPDVLLLDEATSALDIKSEEEILQEIKKIMGDGIIISIAHRISSNSFADQILILNQGKILESGTHGNLLKTSLYYQYATKFSKLIN